MCCRDLTFVVSRERKSERDTLNCCCLLFLLPRCLTFWFFSWNKQSVVQMGWSNLLLQYSTESHARMTSNSKSIYSSAIKAEVKRHESLQSAINRLSKQFERVVDQQLRSGLKVYLHSIQGESSFSEPTLRTVLKFLYVHITANTLSQWSTWSNLLHWEYFQFHKSFNVKTRKNICTLYLFLIFVGAV